MACSWLGRQDRGRGFAAQEAQSEKADNPCAFAWRIASLGDRWYGIGMRLLPGCSAFAVVERGGGMARKRSLWAELQRERERRERAARAQERENEQIVRQLVRDHDRAEREAVRAATTERKRREQLAHGRYGCSEDDEGAVGCPPGRAPHVACFRAG